MDMDKNTCLVSENLAVTFGGLKALDGANFSLNKCEVLGLIGPNGSGKTTLINVITGVYKATAGRIIFQGEIITGLHPHEIRARGISRTFQSNRMCWGLSLLDNILLGLHAKQATKWWEVICKPKAWQKELDKGIEKICQTIYELTPGLIDKCNTPIASIPFIDRRRAEIVRALVSEPSLLLLDEPTAGLNPVETMEIIEDIIRFKSLYPNMSIILIEHDMNVIANMCSRVVVLNAGKKIADGPYSDIIQIEEVINAYLGEME